MMEAVNISEKSVNIYQTTKLKIPEDSISLLGSSSVSTLRDDRSFSVSERQRK
jgi:hypothetical protein